MENTAKFTGKHLDYAAARPSYPEALLSHLRGRYTPPCQFTVADIGSGTGKFSAQLLDSGFTVYGVEPNGDMRGTAEALLGADPRFISVNGSDKRTGLADGSVDFVTVAQAFHWFDPQAFRGECLRVLKPCGRVFLIWNSRTASSQNAALSNVFQTYCPDFHGFSGGITEDDDAIRDFFAGSYSKEKFANPITFTKESFLRRCFSASYSLPQTHPNYAIYCRALEAVFDAFSQNGLLPQPNETVVYEGCLSPQRKP